MQMNCQVIFAHCLPNLIYKETFVEYICTFQPFPVKAQSSVSLGVSWFITHFRPSDYNDDKRDGATAHESPRNGSNKRKLRGMRLTIFVKRIIKRDF